jgi:hypothetical protein
MPADLNILDILYILIGCASGSFSVGLVVVTAPASAPFLRSYPADIDYKKVHMPLILLVFKATPL